MLHAVDAALAVVARDPNGGVMDTRELFNGFDPSKYEAEAQERWGDTDGYQESIRRTKGYTPGGLEAAAGGTGRDLRRGGRRDAPRRRTGRRARGLWRSRGAPPPVDRQVVLPRQHARCTRGWPTCMKRTTASGHRSMRRARADHVPRGGDRATQPGSEGPGPHTHIGRGFSSACPAQSRPRRRPSPMFRPPSSSDRS